MHNVDSSFYQAVRLLTTSTYTLCNIGIMWLALQCPEGSKGRQRTATEKVERGVARYFQSNFNFRDQAGEVSCGAFRIAVSMQYVSTYTSG